MKLLWWLVLGGVLTLTAGFYFAWQVPTVEEEQAARRRYWVCVQEGVCNYPSALPEKLEYPASWRSPELFHKKCMEAFYKDD